MDKLPEWMLESHPARPPSRWRRLMDRIGPAAIRDRVAHRYVRTTKVVSGIAAAVALFGTAAVIWAGYAVMNRAEAPAPGTIPAKEPAAVDAYAGTPAERFAVGASGIVAPPATRTGPFSAGEVATAMAQVKHALINARLDARMLVRHDHRPYLELLPPSTRGARQADFNSSRYATYATQIADHVSLANQPPRVKGTMTYRITGTRSAPVLEVTTNYVWVYPLIVEGVQPTTVVVHDRQVWQRVLVAAESNGASDTRHISLVKADAAMDRVDCAQLRSTGRIAPESGGRSAAGDRNAFDPAQPIRTGLTC